MATYKKRLWRIRKNKVGEFIVQSSRFGIFWSTVTESRRYYHGTDTWVSTFDNESSAIGYAEYQASKHKLRWECEQEKKKVEKESKQYRKDLGRLPP